VAPNVGIGERQGYAGELAGLWSELNRTLRRLESLAGREPVDPAVSELARLQYALHLYGERMVGMTPPPGAEAAHEELSDSLACARDSTAEVVEATETGGWELAAPLVYEWRGALFRVRLARLMLTPPRPRPVEAEPAAPGSDVLAPLVAFGLTAAGAAAFTCGAIVAVWPLWFAGMVSVVAGLLVYRP
jgi:hypothetical protein